MTKHTPGPWEVWSDLRIVTTATPVKLVADVIDRGTEGRANARLIAAAPDLIEACEAYLYGRKGNRACEAMMRAAIAKATQPQPTVKADA